MQKRLGGAVSAVDCPVAIAVDVGGSRIKSALVDAHGAPAHQELRATPGAAGSDPVFDTICEIVADLHQAATDLGHTVVAVGVAVPGLVDDDSGIAKFSANLGWRDLDLRDGLRQRLQWPVALGQDIRSGALAEGELGAAVGVPDFLFVALGTGIGAAMMSGGCTISGAHGCAGELGHILVTPEGELCACGQRGCLETVASAPAIARSYLARTGSSITAEEVSRRVVSGDPDAAAVWKQAVTALAAALVTCQTLMDPSLIVVGGGLSQAGDVLLEPLRAAVVERLSFQHTPRIVAAQLGDRAGCLGAGILAWDLVGP